MKVGLDGGGCFLKACVNIVPQGDGKESLIMPAKKKPNLGRICLESGVKKLLIVGLVEEVPEMYDNMQTFLTELQLSFISFTAAVDL